LVWREHETKKKVSPKSSETGRFQEVSILQPDKKPSDSALFFLSVKSNALPEFAR